MKNTITLQMKKKCEHRKNVHKKAVVNLLLFSLEMTYEVCTNCGEMKPVREYWRIN